MQTNLVNARRIKSKKIIWNQTAKIISYQKIKRIKNDENSSFSVLSLNLKSQSKKFNYFQGQLAEATKNQSTSNENKE